MKKEVHVNIKKSQVIKVDDASVWNGIYAREGSSHLIAFVYVHDGLFRLKYTNGGDSLTYMTIAKLMDNFPSYNFFENGVIIDNTSNIDDLKNTDHIGFIDTYNSKWEVVLAIGGVNAICCDHKVWNEKYQLARSVNDKSVSELMAWFTETKSVFVFDTRKELYQWLAE